MKAGAIIASLVMGLAAGAGLAQGQAAPPTRVAETGTYVCPAHPRIQATWPTRCPICGNVLQEMPPSAATAVGVAPVTDINDLRRARENRRNDLLRQRQLRGQERLNADERARREQELQDRYRHYGYAYPPGGYAYGFPPTYEYRGNQGYYGYTYPGPGYDFGFPPFGPYRNNQGYYSAGPGYYYNPGTGRYYNPNTGFYYYPDQGYYYNPNSGYFSYSSPDSANPPYYYRRWEPYRGYWYGQSGERR